MIEFNYDNIIINIDFKTWIKSICTEINKILSNSSDTFVAEAKIKPTYWGEGIPAQSIYIFNTFNGGLYFSIAEFEYEQNKGNKEHLNNLVKTRLLGFLYSLEQHREDIFRILRQFDPQWETPDDFLY